MNDSTAFDDDSQIVGTTEIDFDAMDARLAGEEPEPIQQDEARSSQEATRRLLMLLTTNADSYRAGQRAILLAYLLGVSDCQTQAQLAERMSLTPGRISQALNILRREFATLARL
jgi:hypothetical protein